MTLATAENRRASARVREAVASLEEPLAELDELLSQYSMARRTLKALLRRYARLRLIAGVGTEE